MEALFCFEQGKRRLTGYFWQVEQKKFQGILYTMNSYGVFDEHEERRARVREDLSRRYAAGQPWPGVISGTLDYLCDGFSPVYTNLVFPG
jgi:hypothetical protein